MTTDIPRQNAAPSTPFAPQRLTVVVLVVAIVMAVFAGPLFIGLDRWDLDNDEAIYAYAVDRILETGDWLTPRAIPTDTAFLEKPPLKFWIVAAGMALGLTPHDELGMRVFDALFGAAAFGYILAFGWRLAGPICGAVALLVLFAIDPLIFNHGLRSHNMEAALLLSYCGGLYHVLRWSEIAGSARRRHAFGAAAYFVLGFMTKFVAALLLPMVAVAWLLFHSSGRERLRSRWRDWVLPALVGLLAIAPWFAYQWLHAREAFWSTIFGQHVYARFTASLDPSHLEPWHFYVTHLWKELAHGDVLILVLAGLVLAVVNARRSPFARLILVWFGAPLVLLSLGTSKLFHYAYPFLPPLALAAGWVCVVVLTAIRRRIGTSTRSGSPRDRPLLRWTLLGLAGISASTAAWTLIAGAPTLLTVGETVWFRNSSVLMPAVAAVALAIAASRGRTRLSTAVTVGLLLFLPLSAFEERVQKVFSYDRPLGAARDCIRSEQTAGRATAGIVYLATPNEIRHPSFYYFRGMAEWPAAHDEWREHTRQRLFDAGTPVVVSDARWPSAGADMLPEGAYAVRMDDIVLLLPAQYAACEALILAYGGHSHTEPPMP